MLLLAPLLASLWMLEVERTDEPTARHDWISGDAACVESVKGRDGELPISVRLQHREVEGETVWTGEVVNRTTNRLVHCLSVRPFVRKVPTDFEAVYYPGGLGLRYGRLPKATDGDVVCGWERLGGIDRKRLFGFHCDWPVMPGRYPSYRTTMTWCAMAGRGGGVYWGCHNPKLETVYPRPLYDPVRHEMVFCADFDVMLSPGRSWQMPPIVEADYRGTWHVAARRYRRWFQGVHKPIDDPPLGLTGQLLCILKQQNGEIIWPYTELDRLGDVACAHGLNWVGLFGWTAGGHDHLYPDYDPDPAMGGREALKAGIRALHARGLRCYIYANGQLQEREKTDFWWKTGRNLAVLRANGTAWTETWHKYSNAPAHVFDLGCLHSEAWYQRMKELAVQANELGADGILYDQLGNSPPRPCYGKGHGHDGPAMCFADDTVRFLSRLRREMRAVNPQFTLHSEGVGDSYSDSIDFYHGMSTGAHPYMCLENVKRRLGGGVNEGPDYFPELFRYTFPRIVSTSRMPSPFLTRDCVNYDMIFGLRHEIEIRYTPDRRFIETGKVPARAEYGSVLGPPALDLMRGLEQRAAQTYLKQVCDFQRQWAKYLLFGDYCDTEGVELRGEGLAARRFRAADGSSAVLVWNVSEKPVRPEFIRPSVPMRAASPEMGEVDVASPVPAQTLRLYCAQGSDPALMKL